MINRQSGKLDSFIYKIWNAIHNDLKVDSKISGVEFEIVMKNYQRPERYYHNQTHISHRLQQLEPVFNKLENRTAVLFAVFYHDAVYDSRQKDNEKQSAQLASSYLSQFDRELSEQVAELVLTTEKHQLFYSTSDEKYFLDADLSILGESSEVYIQYAQKIRKEYGWVEAADFKRERHAVLERLSRSDFIFFSDYFREKFEAMARKNLQMELDSRFSY